MREASAQQSSGVWPTQEIKKPLQLCAYLCVNYLGTADLNKSGTKFNMCWLWRGVRPGKKEKEIGVRFQYLFDLPERPTGRNGPCINDISKNVNVARTSIFHSRFLFRLEV